MRNSDRAPRVSSDAKRDISSLTDRVIDARQRAFDRKPRDKQIQAIVAILDGRDSVLHR